MRLLEQYITDFLQETDANRQALGQILQQTRQTFDVQAGSDPRQALQDFVDRYNWLGDLQNKQTYNITQNLARNLVGALMQDYLINIAIARLSRYPTLDTFTEVRVPYGTFPLWKAGEIERTTPSQVVDLAVGYLFENGERVVPEDPWPRPAIHQLGRGRQVMPLIIINSKIRVSQGEFFDWLGRDRLLSRGNPDCLSLQVALRTEMDLSILDAAQAAEKFILLGQGGERNVVPTRPALRRLVSLIDGHLKARML